MAHASFEMISGLLQKASRLPAGSSVPTSHSRPKRPGCFQSATPTPPLVGSLKDSDACPLRSDCESYTSGAIHTGDSDLSLLRNTDIDVESTGHESTRPPKYINHPGIARGLRQQPRANHTSVTSKSGSRGIQS